MRRGHQRFIPLYTTLSILAGLLIVAFLFIADKLADQNIHFYINYRGITIGKVYVVAVWLACLLFITGINAFLHRHFSSYFFKGIILLGALLVACYFAFSMLFEALFFMPRSYVASNSPGGEYQIIVGEDNRLTEPYGGTIYLRTSRITVRELGEYEADAEFPKPFSARKFYIDWNENDFDIHYDYDGEGNYKTLTFAYPK